MRLCVMVEGQEDVAWEQWLALAAACEAHGYEALFRSDHYATGEAGREAAALDAWATLAGLAAATSTVRLGTLVSPATFRHPAVLAKNAVTVDHISAGRVELGMGAGWMELEHERFGFPFPPTRVRMDMFAEQLELVHRQWAPGPFSFEGAHYRMIDADPLPKPLQSPRPPLIVGGSGGQRSVALAARWADEYNTVFAGVQRCRELRGRVVEACEREGREPLRFSLMTAFIAGADRSELLDRARRLGGEHLLESPPPGWLVGTPDELVGRLSALADAGVERLMLQHLLHTDLDVLELLARDVAPQLR